MVLMAITPDPSFWGNICYYEIKHSRKGSRLRKVVSLFFCIALAASLCLEGQARPPLSSGFFRALQQVTGINWLGRTVTEKILEKQLSKLSPVGRISCKVKLYSVFDLAHGKAKRVACQGRELKIYKQYRLSAFSVATITPIWFELKPKIRPKEPLVFDFSFKMTEADLNQSFLANAEKLQNLRIKALGLTKTPLQVLNPTVTLMESALITQAQLHVAGAEVDQLVPIVLKTEPVLQDARLLLTNTALESTQPLAGYGALLQDYVNKNSLHWHQTPTYQLKWSQFRLGHGQIEATGQGVFSPQNPYSQSHH
jgi:hypothetical protein